ncbi:hypothetical protein ACFO9Q_08340 [Paenibacillus sp. GCM10023252]|uniref:hypothetical protein n=1 Tax=Paenibacillus sp. GCM10023252 TaxID=3252649 RepID=UPI0036205DCC
MIPFERAWPYDLIMNDVYIPNCPFCGEDNVLVALRPEEIKEVQEGKKRLLIFPCCRNKVTLVDADRDYLLTTQTLRKLGQ